MAKIMVGKIMPCELKLLRTQFWDIPVIVDRSLPSNCIEFRHGAECERVCWPDETTELARWDDDGGRAP